MDCKVFVVMLVLLLSFCGICFTSQNENGADEAGIQESSVVGDATFLRSSNSNNDGESRNAVAGVVTKSCPFVYQARAPAPEVGLINCTWYSSNSCCKRTEVTSVFSGMLALNTPPSMDQAKAKKCRNMLNYMMCYFCDPNQDLWYTTTVKICEEFCTSAYTSCSEAMYNDQTIGEVFANGEELCQAQKFKVISGDTNCFKFDPTVFDGGLAVVPSVLTVFVGAVLPLLLYRSPPLL